MGKGGIYLAYEGEKIIKVSQMHSQRPSSCLGTCEQLNGPRPAPSHSSSSSLFSSLVLNRLK